MRKCHVQFPQRWAQHAMLISALLIPAQMAQAQLTQRALRQIAQQAIESPSVDIQKPTFEIKEGTLAFFLGSWEKNSFLAPETIGRGAVAREGRGTPAPSASDLIDFAVDSQLKVELLKEFAPPGYLMVANRYLQEAEQIIDRMLVLAARGKGQQIPLDEAGAYFNELLHLSVRAYAFSNNLRLVESRGQRPIYNRRLAEVTIETVPPGGTPSVVPHLDWLIARAAGTQPKWIILSQTEKIRLLGVFNYKIEWPDGRTRSPESPTEIYRDGPVTLQ